MVVLEVAQLARSVFLSQFPMNLQTLKLKASTLCAGGTLLVFGGFLTVNLAGCGGGGGGGLTTAPTPSPVGATFRIVLADGSASRGGTVTLTGNGRTLSGTADNNGVAVIPGATPGTYTATFTAFGSNGGSLGSTTRQVVVTKAGAQNFTLVQGDTGNGIYNLSGTIFINPNNADNTNCTATSQPYTGAALISVRDLSDTSGSPIVAQITRPLQDTGTTVRGQYTISIPVLPAQGTFRVEVSPAGNQGAPIAGISATTTFTSGSNSLQGVNVCANLSGTIPVPLKTPTPTPTNFIFPTPTGTFVPTATPVATATVAATATATSQPGATATVAPGATATTRPIVTAAPTTAPGPLFTPGPATNSTPGPGTSITPANLPRTHR